MRDLVTPKQVARALEVSESSIKRWCDKGLIPTRYTAGGHRRIPLAELLEYLRVNKHPMIRPDALGLPPTSGRTTRVMHRSAAQFTEALLTGDEAKCREIAFDLYLAEHSLSSICDELFAKSFTEIGDRWQCGDAEVYQERRGCEISLRVLHELRSIIPAAPPNAPLALGGTPEGDQYNLGTTMAEIVLRDVKWRAVSLGDNLPFATLSAAIQEHQPKLFWLSCSYIEDESTFLREYGQLYDDYGMAVAFVVGGRALTDVLRQQMKYAAYCDNMQHLEAFAQTLRGAIEPHLT